MLKRILQIVAVLGSGLYLYNKIPDPNVPSTPPKTVPKVDVTKYAGTWYEIASIPMFYQRGCVNTKAVYSLNPDKSVKVEYNSDVTQELLLQQWQEVRGKGQCSRLR
jgi:lipocalin